MAVGYLEVRNEKENHNKQAESNRWAYICVGPQWKKYAVTVELVHSMLTLVVSLN